MKFDIILFFWGFLQVLAPSVLAKPAVVKLKLPWNYTMDLVWVLVHEADSFHGSVTNNDFTYTILREKTKQSESISGGTQLNTWLNYNISHVSLEIPVGGKYLKTKNLKFTWGISFYSLEFEYDLPQYVFYTSNQSWSGIYNKHASEIKIESTENEIKTLIGVLKTTTWWYVALVGAPTAEETLKSPFAEPINLTKTSLVITLNREIQCETSLGNVKGYLFRKENQLQLYIQNKNSAKVTAEMLKGFWIFFALSSDPNVSYIAHPNPDSVNQTGDEATQRVNTWVNIEFTFGVKLVSPSDVTLTKDYYAIVKEFPSKLRVYDGKENLQSLISVLNTHKSNWKLRNADQEETCLTDELVYSSQPDQDFNGNDFLEIQYTTMKS